jgi:hypothetical protein
VTKILFWNVANQPDASAIGWLCRERDIDILLLVEAGDASAILATKINDASGLRQSYWELPRAGSRVRALTRYTPGALVPSFDDGHVRILHLEPTIGVPLLLVVVHLPSKLHARDADQSYRVRQLRQDIEREEAKAGHQNTLVIGDLNLDPFEDALTAADGLHAVMDKAVAMRSPRTVRGKAWDYFYNPMWSRLGDESVGPPGTYWHSGSGLVTRFWHTFDQVLLRPSLLPLFGPGHLSVLDHVEDAAILPRDSRDGGLSDHLPIVVEISIERGTIDG